ncbi:tetratricopeptide repeat protein [Tenacibaculum amylolyticum]|uniref:tetratricopeptide repeat protein n=1 Tax=Tenacibaculum amylolyticum TaxID=104269 RepID=UPI0038B620A6
MLTLAELQYDRDFAMSKELLADAFNLIGEKKDSASQKQLAYAYVVGGVIKRREGLYPKALENYLKAKRIYNDFNDEQNVSDVLHNMAMVYRYQKEHQKAIDLYKKSIAVKESLNDIHGIGAGYNMMGISYRHIKKLDSALVFYNKAKSLF